MIIKIKLDKLNNLLFIFLFFCIIKEVINFLFAKSLYFKLILLIKKVYFYIMKKLITIILYIFIFSF